MSMENPPLHAWYCTIKSWRSNALLPFNAATSGSVDLAKFCHLHFYVWFCSNFCFLFFLLLAFFIVIMREKMFLSFVCACARACVCVHARACVCVPTRTLLAFYGQRQCHPQMVIHMHESSFTSGSQEGKLAFTCLIVNKHTLWMRGFYDALPLPFPFLHQKGALRSCGSSYDSFTPLHLNNWSPWEAPGPPYGSICLCTLFLCHLLFFFKTLHFYK